MLALDYNRGQSRFGKKAGFMKVKEPAPPLPPAKELLNIEVQKEQSYMFDIVIVRVLFAVTLMGAAYFIRPFGLSGWPTLVLSFLGALGIIYFEHRLKSATLKRLIGAAIGSILGIIGAFLISALLELTSYDSSSLS